MEKRAHKSQFTYTGSDADDRPLILSDRDTLIFSLLDPEHGYHYLPTNWIHAFVRGDELRLAKRLGRLAREPHVFLARRQDWYKHAVYARTPKADAHLGERTIRDRDPFAHRLLEDLVQASIALGVNGVPDLQLMSWRDLAATGKIPAVTIESSEPHAIPLRTGKLIPDGKPFAIKSKNQWRFVLGQEIDRGTEPLKANHARRSIKEKFEHYRECFEDRRYATHYGFPNSVVLFEIGRAHV